MKKNMKKLYSLLLMAMLVLGLTACGSGEVEENTSDIDSAYAENISNFLVANLVGMETEDLQYYADMDGEELQSILDSSGIPVTTEAFQNIFSIYLSSEEELGDFVDIDGYEMKTDAEGTIMTTKLIFSDHEATMQMILDEDGIVTSTSLDPVYTMGEILQKAGLNTLIGMGTVFLVLIFISFLISLLPKITAVIEGGGKKQEAAPEQAKAVSVPAEIPAEAELADDLELVAVISAAIAAYTGTSSDDFVVRSIRRSTSNKWKKA